MLLSQVECGRRQRDGVFYRSLMWAQRVFGSHLRSHPSQTINNNKNNFEMHPHAAKLKKTDHQEVLQTLPC